MAPKKYNRGMDMKQRIRDRMEELDLTAKGLSLAAGLNETYVRDLLKADIPNPRLNHIKALAKELRVSVEWLDTGKSSAEVIDIWGIKLDRAKADDARSYLEFLASQKAQSEK